MLLIGHHRRSSSKYLFLRDFIESGKLGDLVGVQASYAIAKPYAYYDVEWHTKKGGESRSSSTRSMILMT